jgi:hypothetical protein
MESPNVDVRQALDFLKLLANETRLKLLGALAARERSVGELAEIVRLKEPTVSHHLGRLAAGDLVSMRSEGTAHLYRLNAESLQRLSRELFSPERVVRYAGTDEAAAWEHKVLQTFLDGERLTKIPDVRKKRDVVLRWLVERFEVGREYREREVNEILQRHHADSATLRRELVGARLMQREAGVYWRTADAA